MKAGSLSEIINRFDQQRALTPELEEEWRNFYIDTHRPEIDLIKTHFLRSSPGFKLLFGGHMGNGKSTELNKLIHAPEMQKQFAVIHFDIRKFLDTHDLEVVELLLTICFQLLSFAGEKRIPLAPYIRNEFEKLEGFFRDRLTIGSLHTDIKDKEAGVQTEAGGGLSLPFLNLRALFYAKMKALAEYRKMVRKEYRPRLTELVELIKSLLVDLKAKLKTREPLVVIDGLDRISSVKTAEKLFVEDGQNIAMLDNASMLLTVPISVIHSVKSAQVESNIGKIWVLKNLRLKDYNNQADDIAKENWRLMKQAVLKRLDEEKQLIEEKALDAAVYYSGGVFTTLINLVADAAVHAETQGETAIGEKDMNQAVIEQKIKKTRPLSRTHWEILLEIDQHKTFISEMDEKKLELLTGLFALEYINGDEWYSVNPLLEERMRQFKALLEANRKENGTDTG